MAKGYDTSSNNNAGNASTVSNTHTCTGSNLVLIVAVQIVDSSITDRVITGVDR